jgi:hypothetical protein
MVLASREYRLHVTEVCASLKLKAEHVRVLGNREVHKLVGARLAVSYREASTSL